MNIPKLYRQASNAGHVRFPDRNALQRARRAYAKNLAEPGDCGNDDCLLAGLAIAQADVGVRPGWIPEVQRIGCNIATIASLNR